ncbi:MAG: hypothetical protein KKC37_00905, partial [Proteobacteria bacterium]|nr:hypothetical protein [Pseudomonadota bacterium]
CGVRGTKVFVDTSRYTPHFTADLGYYRGKRIYLMWVVNTALDTSIFYYYSPQDDFTYQCEPTLERYFHSMIAKALRGLGMLVSLPANPDPWVPAVRITTLSMTDVRFHFRVVVQRRGLTIFRKVYTVTQPPLRGEGRTAANQERRAYRMVTRMVETVFSDPRFRSAFARARVRR